MKSTLRGEYENRIFQESNVEKIFEVFATIYRDRAIYMSYHDVIRSICPFSYSTKSREEIEAVGKALDNTTILRLFDLDRTGDISVEEYVFFLTMYYMREEELRRRFASGQITKESFLPFYEGVQKRYDLTLTVKGTLDPRSVRVDEGSHSHQMKVIKTLFKHQEQISIADLIAIKERIRYEVDYYRVG